MAKSAQFLIHGWLDDAMKWPILISTLIHAAIMGIRAVPIPIFLPPLLGLARVLDSSLLPLLLLSRLRLLQLRFEARKSAIA
ncbi:hypothetical protein L484_024811 [Morus notabilis]|uniref:Uncharacterized protein n=1 Tax=Morus notabilis TaxID=981085 RepID=W9QWF2_9ROSA|nr:hypothetical protein L484_024811 [Morus notabilis]